jgi:hypothetical protein
LFEKTNCDHFINISYYSGTNQRKFKHSAEEIELTKVVKIDQNCSESDITIFIHSAATTSGNYFDKRQATRKTWVSDAIKLNITVFFVIAEPKDETMQKELESEALQYKDMIQFNFRDDYYNLTLKHIAFMRWAQQKCLDTKYIMKTDDDIIVNIDELAKNVKNFESGITGVLLNKQKPNRDPNSKWYMPESIYPDEYYPNYPTGAAYIMTRDIIKSWNETFEKFSGPVIDIDDVFIAGIIPEKAGIKRYNSNKFEFGDQCNTRNEVCFMFTKMVLFQCNTANDSIEFWNKFKQTNPDSCPNSGNSVELSHFNANFLIILLLLLISLPFN